MRSRKRAAYSNAALRTIARRAPAGHPPQAVPAQLDRAVRVKRDCCRISGCGANRGERLRGEQNER
jgi:hypothetical protein